jgi:tetratricopeptide (TPR) repeat protein
MPFALAALLALAATLWARATAAGIWTTAEPHALDLATLAHRLMRALYHWLHVLWQPLVPFGLSPVYTDLTNPNPLAVPYLLAAAAFAGVTAGVLGYARRSAVPLVLWLAHLLFLLPYVGLTEAVHYPNDRYTYVHAILVAVTLAAWASARVKPALVAVGAALALGWAVLAAQQTKVWRNDETLFRHAIESVGNDPYRGDLTWRLASTLQKAGRADEARRLYEETLRIATGATARAAAHHGLALMDFGAGAVGEASEHWRQAVDLSPDTIVYLQWYSFALLQTGRIQAAWPVILRGRQLAPSNPEFLQYEQGARQLLASPGRVQP